MTYMNYILKPSSLFMRERGYERAMPMLSGACCCDLMNPSFKLVFYEMLSY